MTRGNIGFLTLAFMLLILFATDALVADTAAADEAYILTPKASAKPRINGAKVFGVRPGRPFLFTIPATGKLPIVFSAKGLPKELKLDEQTGHITGSISARGTYQVTLQAKNALGRAERQFKIVVSDKIALTPPMGWNSWNCWGCSVDDEKVRAAADAMVSSGLINHGWTYINIDDCWQGKRDPNTEEIQSNEKFPDMKALCDYVHSKGLKIGLYTDCGTMTCQRFEGSKGHEQQDILTYAKWGVDYVKIDWCYTEGMEPVSAYRKFGDALKKAPRDIVFSICNWGGKKPWEWGQGVGGNLWRTTGDITDAWESMANIGFKQAPLAKFAGPGHFNDPDMLVVGRVGWGPELHPSRLTPDEQYTHISLWCLLSAPLLIGCDLSQLDGFTLNLLTNDEVLEVNQDPLGDQAERISRHITRAGSPRPFAKGRGSTEVWAKTMEDGSKAVGLFNVSLEETQVRVGWSQLGIKGKQTVRDLWRQKDIGVFKNEFDSDVAPHGVVLVRITPLSADK